jgi:hypothetical protein
MWFPNCAIWILVQCRFLIGLHNWEYVCTFSIKVNGQPRDNMFDNEQEMSLRAAHVKLESFWPSKPLGWFAQAEAIFAFSGSRTVSSDTSTPWPPPQEHHPWHHGEPPAEHPYKELKEKLLQCHSLNMYQSFEKLNTVPALGGQSPRGEERSRLFTCLFLHRLPRQLRLLLTHEDLTDLKRLAARQLGFTPTIGTSLLLPPRSRTLSWRRLTDM